VDLHSRLSSIARGDGAWTPPAALPAATIVLSRGDHVLVMRRVETMAFAPRMHVFPGGRLEEIDLTADDPFLACAIREAREEVGIVVTGDIRLIDHWITPEFESRRFDVRFFLAEVTDPGDLVTTEADQVMWLSIDDALAEHEQGRLPMLRPTVEVLGLVQRILAGDPVPPVTPKLPRPRDAAGVLAWDIVHADTGEVLARDIIGPGYAEVEGVAVR
jgi:8-oxo-dGTP pyrophosphatase MutT (NUDIX family)